MAQYLKPIRPHPLATTRRNQEPREFFRALSMKSHSNADLALAAIKKIQL